MPAGSHLAGLEELIRNEAFAVPPNAVIDLSHLPVPTTWEIMVIIPPYPDPGDFLRAVGFEWAEWSASSVASEGNVLAFVRDAEVVAWVRITRDVYFLTEGDQILIVPREIAQFRVVPEPPPDTFRRLLFTPS